MPLRAPSKPPVPTEILENLCLGYNGYTSPNLANPKMWAAANNVFAGAFGFIQRCRFATIVSGLGTGQTFASLKYFAIPTSGAWLLGDINGKLFSYDTSANYGSTQRLNPYVDPSGAGTSLLNGPFSREVLQSIAYEMNGQVKFTGRNANAATIEGWGLDSPDAAPAVQVFGPGGIQTANITGITRAGGVVTITVASTTAFGTIGTLTLANIAGVSDNSFNGTFNVTIASGTTFTFMQVGFVDTTLGAGGTINYQITKAIGRSYAYAWENANKTHVGSISPVTQYIAYNLQNGVVTAFEIGAAALSNSSTTVTGTGTFFTNAWVGRSLWVSGYGNAGRIVSVTDATHLVLATTPASNVSATNFQIFDPQATHIRWYETADGGATYFRVARNVFDPTQTAALNAGLQYVDRGNSEPPNLPFTTETAQVNNVPPPIGKFVNEYQGVLVVYGVTGAPQSFFYSNQSATTIGLLQESFAPLNQVTLPIQNAQLNGMIEFPGALIMWSDKQDMFRMTGLLTDNIISGMAQNTSASQQGATIARLPYNLGCATPFAAEITPLGGIWLTSNAEVWLYTDVYAPRNIGRPIQDILNSISTSKLSLARMKYYHTNNRNWLFLSVAANGASSNNTLLVLDLDLLASNGSPSYFTFDMATNSPAWYVFTLAGDSIETVYENSGNVRVLCGTVDKIQDADYQAGFGTEQVVSGGTVTFHAWGNDSAFLIKRPSWFRFTTNRPPANLAGDGWSFAALGIDDDVYTFASPLTLALTPGVNDVATLGGNADFATAGLAFRYSQGLFKIGGVNFVMGRRIRFQVNFPTATGTNYQLQSIQIGFTGGAAN